MRTIKLHHSFTFNQIFDELNNFKNDVSAYPNFIFRGQTDETWTLQPSFTRISLQKTLNRIQTLKLEHECLDKFVISAKNLLLPQQTLPLTINGKTDFIPWLILMQHFSAPTRMLDWTTSPIVALYFCCCNQFDRDGAIYIAEYKKILSSPDLEKEFLEGVLSSTSRNILMTITAFVTNERLEAQQGKFTVCTNPRVDHQKILSEMGILTKIIVPKEIKLKTKEQLYQFNINAKTLFPGIDGLGKSVLEYSLLWNKSSMQT